MTYHLISHEELLTRHAALLDGLKETTRKKNADYAGSSPDAFFNMRMVELMQITSTETGILTRMSDKFSRIISLIKRAKLDQIDAGDGMVASEVSDESITDTLLDFANYNVLLAIYLQQKLKARASAKRALEG